MRRVALQEADSVYVILMAGWEGDVVGYGVALVRDEFTDAGIVRTLLRYGPWEADRHAAQTVAAQWAKENGYPYVDPSGHVTAIFFPDE